MSKVSEKTLVLRNKCFTYLLPMLGTNSNHFKNCSACFYSNDDKKIKNRIFLLYRMNKDWSKSMHKWLEKHNLFDDFYNVDDTYKMYIFKLPKGYEKNYHLFINGKYSLFDDEYKNHIIKFHQNNYGIEEVKKVLYKDESLYKKLETDLDVIISREQEISSIPDKKEEVFYTINYIQNKQNTI